MANIRVYGRLHYPLGLFAIDHETERNDLYARSVRFQVNNYYKASLVRD
jgi:hypothetical protein